MENGQGKLIQEENFPRIERHGFLDGKDFPSAQHSYKTQLNEISEQLEGDNPTKLHRGKNKI